MKSKEIEELLELKQFLITIDEYVNILYTSPQISDLSYNKDEDNFCIKTDDRFSFNFKLKK